MGVGVAQCLAEAGHRVVVVDPSEEARSKGPRRLNDGLRTARLLRTRTKGAAPASPAASAPAPGKGPAADVAARISWVPHLSGLDGASFVIECGPERIPVKEAVFKELDAVCPADAVFASCTSAIPVAQLAAYTQRPDRVIGTHFMNPAYLKDAVEVIRGPRTASSTLDATLALLATMGKRGHVVRDAPGFVSNRILMPVVNDAAALLQAGTSDAGTVDKIFEECFGHAMGPLRTADLIGLDTVLDSLHVLLETTGDPRFEPCDLLVDLVRRGECGRKSGQGFYSYTSHGAHGAHGAYESHGSYESYGSRR
ncbi:3-hydroxyacyl-CoA dehydrogenase family protein [Streptomyces sp. MST-110588]|nr:3-hydroxyacyl-CoA dehydrogenase family protein [Streptomyces sp. MST-110588]